LHYDELHYEKYKKLDRLPRRAGDYCIFQSVANAHRKKLCIKMTLPQEVKCIFRRTVDEQRWEKLECLKPVIAKEIQAETSLEIENEQDAEALANAIARSSGYYDEVGPGYDKLPAGCRVLIDVERDASPQTMRDRVVEQVRASAFGRLRVLMRPLHSSRRPPLLDEMGRKILNPDLSMHDIAVSWSPAPLTVDGCLDRMLLVLWDARFLSMSEDWSTRGLGNCKADETCELARWWIKGQHVGSRPLFEGHLITAKLYE